MKKVKGRIGEMVQGYKHWLLFPGIRIQFLPLLCWLTSFCNFSSRGADALSWFPKSPMAQVVHRQTCWQNIHTHKKIIHPFFPSKIWDSIQKTQHKCLKERNLCSCMWEMCLKTLDYMSCQHQTGCGSWEHRRGMSDEELSFMHRDHSKS